MSLARSSPRVPAVMVNPKPKPHVPCVWSRLPGRPTGAAGPGPSLSGSTHQQAVKGPVVRDRTVACAVDHSRWVRAATRRESRMCLACGTPRAFFCLESNFKDRTTRGPNGTRTPRASCQWAASHWRPWQLRRLGAAQPGAFPGRAMCSLHISIYNHEKHKTS